MPDSDFSTAKAGLLLTLLHELRLLNDKLESSAELALSSCHSLRHISMFHFMGRSLRTSLQES